MSDMLNTGVLHQRNRQLKGEALAYPCAMRATAKGEVPDA
jgi:hypothetical protein